MNHHRKKMQRKIISILAASLPLSFLTGCSADEKNRNYTIPRSLCGIKVVSDELTAFLPPGEKIKVRKEIRSWITTCKVVVDDTLILTTTHEWLPKGRTTTYFASGQTLEDINFSAEGGRFRYSGNEGFGKTQKCVDEVRGQELYAALQASGSKHMDSDAMKHLIISYTKEVEKSPDCTETLQ
ncbi:hypothetical protein ACF07S_19830 [Streptomyces sp. NPDC016640]|uniref:hypothetical protein n=1 Tax=Streptomyces sp. NPDC016640 TaxID=3364969 RepID=UPI0036FFE795